MTLQELEKYYHTRMAGETGPDQFLRSWEWIASRMLDLLFEQDEEIRFLRKSMLDVASVLDSEGCGSIPVTHPSTWKESDPILWAAHILHTSATKTERW